DQGDGTGVAFLAQRIHQLDAGLAVANNNHVVTISYRIHGGPFGKGEGARPRWPDQSCSSGMSTSMVLKWSPAVSWQPRRLRAGLRGETVASSISSSAPLMAGRPSRYSSRT